MNLKNNQQGFSMIGSTAIIIGVIIFFSLGYLILGLFSGGSKEQTTNPDQTKVSKISTPTNINNGNRNPEAVLVPALNLKIADPDNRQLIVETINSTNTDSTSSQQVRPGYYIRDNNKEFFNRCKYPVRIIKYDSSVDNSSGALSPYIKNINNTDYFAGLGSFEENKKCPNAKPEDINYIANFRTYIIANLQAN